MASNSKTDKFSEKFQMAFDSLKHMSEKRQGHLNNSLFPLCFIIYKTFSASNCTVLLASLSTPILIKHS